TSWHNSPIDCISNALINTIGCFRREAAWASQGKEKKPTSCPAGFLVSFGDRRAPAGRSPVTRSKKAWIASVLGLVHQLVLGDPGHHGAKFGADFLDLVAVVHATDALEARGARTVFLHPLRGELAGLDVLQDALHLGL